MFLRGNTMPIPTVDQLICPWVPPPRRRLHSLAQPSLHADCWEERFRLRFCGLAAWNTGWRSFHAWPWGSYQCGEEVPLGLSKLIVHRSAFPIISLLNPTTKYYNFLFEKGIGSHHKWPIKSYSISGWWFQTFFMFHNTLDNFSHWLTHIFQDGKNHQPDMLYSDISIVWLQLTGGHEGSPFPEIFPAPEIFCWAKTSHGWGHNGVPT